MKLMTNELEQKFKQYPLYSQDNKLLDAEVVVKYFNPYGAGTWLITEGEKQENHDWLLFGYMYLFEWEWGYIYLSELENLKNSFNLPLIERDLYSDGKLVKDFIH